MFKKKKMKQSETKEKNISCTFNDIFCENEISFFFKKNFNKLHHATMEEKLHPDWLTIKSCYNSRDKK